MSVVNIRLYDFVRKEMHLSEEKAREFVQAIDEVMKEDVKGEGLNELATKLSVKEEIHKLELKLEQTKSDLTKSIFWAGLIQFLAIVASVVSLVGFMLKK